MNLPFEYDQLAVGEFGGTTPTTTDFDNARVVILPVPLDRTTSYVAGHAQRPARDPGRLVAHGAVGRGNRDRRPQHRHLHAAGDGVPVRDDGRGGRARSGASRRSSSTADKFPFVLGGEHSITPPVVGGASPRNIPACRCCRSTRTPICATRSWARRTTMPARCGACSSMRATTQVGIRSLSPEEAAAAPTLPTKIFYDYNMRRRSRTGSIASSTR